MQQDPATIPPSRAAALRLALVRGVGPRTRQVLLERFGTAEAVLNAAPSDLRSVPRIGAKLCRAISTARDEIDAEAEIRICRQSHIDILFQQDVAYPRL